MDEDGPKVTIRNIARDEVDFVLSDVDLSYVFYFIFFFISRSLSKWRG